MIELFAVIQKFTTGIPRRDDFRERKYVRGTEISIAGRASPFPVPYNRLRYNLNSKVFPNRLTLKRQQYG